MANKQERDLILDMLAAGKIDVCEAGELFDAVECIEEEGRNTVPPATDRTLPLGVYIDQMVQSVQDDIARIVDSAEFPFVMSL